MLNVCQTTPYFLYPIAARENLRKSDMFPTANKCHAPFHGKNHLNQNSSNDFFFSSVNNMCPLCPDYSS